MSDADDPEMYDTASADLPDDDHVPEGLPDDVEIPAQFADSDISLADSAHGATIDETARERVGLVDPDTGDVYVVVLKEITWQKKNQILKQNISTAGGSGSLAIDTYYRDVAEAKIADVEPSVENVTTWLAGLKDSLGAQLEQHLPDPVAELDETTEGN